MIIFLYGSDAYRLKKSREEIINRYRNKYPDSMNLFSVDLTESIGIDILENALKSSSFFNEHKLVVCKNIFSKKAGAESLAKYLRECEISKATDITLIASENMNGKELASKNKELFKTLGNDENMVTEFEPLQGEELHAWIKNEVKSRNCSIGSGQIKILIDLAGNDSWAIINEVDKLTAYKNGSEITLTDIKALIPDKIQNNIFTFIDMFGSGNTQGAMTLLYKELHTNSDPYQILGVIAYQIRNMLTIKDLTLRGLTVAEISKKTGIHSFVVKKVMSGLPRLGLDKLTSMHKNILDIELLSKRGELDIRDSLYNFITL